MDNKEAIYNSEISPLVQQLVEACRKHEIPLFMAFQYADEGFCITSMQGTHPAIKHFIALSQSIVDRGIDLDRYLNWVASTMNAGSGSADSEQSGAPIVPESELKKQEPA